MNRGQPADGRAILAEHTADGPPDGDDGPGDTSRPVTIAFIAESAGVSVPTVSKVINGRSGVSADTRARVEELVDRYGYRKPPGAQRNNVVELVFRELEHLWAAEIIRGVERVARRHRVGVMVSEFGLHDSDPLTWDDTVSRRPNCVLSVAQLSEAERAQLTAKGIPFVVFDPATELPDDVPFVGATNWSGGRAATRHLTELGHRRIAMIAGPRDQLYCCARLDGYRSAMGAAGLPVDPELVVHAPLTGEDGQRAARSLLALPDRPTAIFTTNDLQALGVYQAAREAGLRIPDDLSVVGFDDLPVVAWVDPPLTTVHQPLTEMAVAATELALTLGRGERAPQAGLEIATTLTVRASTAPPPEADRRGH
ncbi:LacI family DNA-binding transcriptional regulator [Streptomyces caniscabiei]|uniref:LacI family DNA-binding transcriptional regulator n=1 Tax=Streptomyces caniscabiei TaxID=2746961 RepID=UPI0029B350C7|nr:LacI family DNA-binding transcriptional regulator [Streptomyces caniscabiei]MDX2600550.1 LacI family DNA-binding transcriptional regulator [Streptomyces caniscabiei]MDX2736869.1 LacI family DNA-binding transcriptional regulator [Streptomyces caniscabiei]MDX2780681.1 LacI family DNA-binding transcriptional regulator [Streptomyces caniscabiei]